jgi:hypothetical protein
MGLIRDVVGGITGSTAASAASRGGKQLSKAALAAAQTRASGGRDAFDFLTNKLDPFIGTTPADFEGLTNLASNPQAQVDFLTNNPLFDALRGDAREATFRTQSAGGMLGSSGTDEILQNKFLTMGNDLINQQINRESAVRMPLLQASQSAATNVASGGSDLLMAIKEALAKGDEDSAQALATGRIGAANAKAQGAENIIGIGGKILGAFSDSRLKTNIEKIGEHNGLNVYSWDWNESASELGLKGKSFGHIAQEVSEVYPGLVGELSGYMTINYSTDKTVNI